MAHCRNLEMISGSQFLVDTVETVATDGVNHQIKFIIT